MLKGGKLCGSWVIHTIQWDLWYKVFSSLETCVTSVAEARNCSSQLPFWGWPPYWVSQWYLSVILTSVYSVIWIKRFPYLHHCCLSLVFFTGSLKFGCKICLLFCGALHCSALVLLGMRGILTLWDLLDSCPSPAAGPPEATVLLLLWDIFLHLQPDMPNPQEGLLL